MERVGGACGEGRRVWEFAEDCGCGFGQRVGSFCLIGYLGQAFGRVGAKPACLPVMQGIPDGHEMELCTMIIECCSNEKTFVK